MHWTKFNQNTQNSIFKLKKRETTGEKRNKNFVTLLINKNVNWLFCKNK